MVLKTNCRTGESGIPLRESLSMKKENCNEVEGNKRWSYSRATNGGYELQLGKN